MSDMQFTVTRRSSSKSHASSDTRSTSSAQSAREETVMEDEPIEEVDEYGLPDENIELPPSEDLLRVATDMNAQIADTDAVQDTPIASKHDKNRRNSNVDADFDVLSTQNDVDEQRDALDRLSLDVRMISAKVDKQADMDLTIRTLMAKIDELSTAVATIRDTQKVMRADMTQYQTITAQSIADVERRAATKQLSTNAKPIAAISSPPSEVTVSRPQTTTDVQGEMVAPVQEAPVRKFVDLSDL